MIFKIPKDELIRRKAFYTANEINQQPETFLKTIEQIKREKDFLRKFIVSVTKKDDFRIILTGAGTSEFIGNTLEIMLNNKYHGKVRSVATTDIVTSCDCYIEKDMPTLIVSFARSGNSPESVGTVELSSRVNPEIKHLYITCNKEGALARDALNNENSYALVLTEETHDKSFAMTSSFTNMCLACLLAFNLDNLDKNIESAQKIINPLEKFLSKEYVQIKNIVEDFDFERIVYLGANAFKGMAQESALKMLELTAGNIVTMFDTPLGFRHGPKSIINPKTLIVVYLSDDEYARKYELDLLHEMSSQRDGNRILCVSSSRNEEIEKLVDYYYSFDNEKKLDYVFLALEYVHIAQTLAFFKSLSLGLTPDNPFPSGTVNRVVKGVKIYK
ncbi:MAG: adhesin [Clostridiales bacterium]|nr:MAG: adhesin [Clostridiales bacterium]